MTELTADELTVLLIAAKGEPMMPTGDSKRDALEKWSRQILTRALEIMR